MKKQLKKVEITIPPLYFLETKTKPVIKKDMEKCRVPFLRKKKKK
jgi:hypothetical protein